MPQTRNVKRFCEHATMEEVPHGFKGHSYVLTTDYNELRKLNDQLIKDAFIRTQEIETLRHELNERKRKNGKDDSDHRKTG